MRGVDRASSHDSLQPVDSPATSGPPAPISSPVFRGRGEESLAAKQLRFRRALDVGYAIWSAFIPMDWVMVRALGAPSFGHMLGCRIFVVVALLPILLRLHRAPAPSLRWLVTMNAVAYGVTAAALGVMCAEFRGLASPYLPGMCLVLLARGVTSQDHWRRGALLSLIPAASFYAALFGASLFLLRLAAQIRDDAALATLALNSAYILGTCVFEVVGGHIVWLLRRQVYEARELGRYRLKRRLAAGAMGEVWVGHHPILKRDVAVKILAPQHEEHVASAAQRFEREARATSELSHPNTIRVYDYGTTDDGVLYYVMELLEGETLADRVARLGPLAPAAALRIAEQAARALGEAHERGIVHRDVTPRNVFLATLGGERDFVKVLDFGIAKIASAGGEAAMTRTGVLLGTPDYISPEVAEGRSADARADVYGLGAVLYFLLTGVAPFAASTVIGALLAHMESPAVAPSRRTGHPFPHDLEQVVMRCLAKDPAERFHDGAALAAALSACTEAATWWTPVLTASSAKRLRSAPAEEAEADGPVDTSRSPAAESIAIDSRRLAEDALPSGSALERAVSDASRRKR